MGTNLFGAVAPESFGDLGTTLFTLFQTMTGEGWPDIAQEVMAEVPLAWIFFVVYILVSSFMVLNLFIAVVVSAMERQVVAEARAEEVEHAADEQIANQMILEEIKALRAAYRVGRRGAAAGAGRSLRYDGRQDAVRVRRLLRPRGAEPVGAVDGRPGARRRELLVLNEELAAELGVDAAALREPAGVSLLVGHGLPDGVTPVAQAYAGHQFGGYVPRLGDGRALLLGEVTDTAGRRRDVHLKGSGRTPFARGGDGKAAVGPMLREYLIGEAMHGLGIPTTRALVGGRHRASGCCGRAALPGAVLCRVAASHLRVGTFQYAAASGDRDVLRALADHAIARHHPEAAARPSPYLELYRRVVDAQAELVARWMLVGFVHGVMNTDNTTISGETIDYGPCAFMDAFDPATVFSSIDHRGRYAYGNQPAIAQWNLARLGETLLPLIDEDVEAGGGGRDGGARRVRRRLRSGTAAAGMAAKLGLAGAGPGAGDRPAGAAARAAGRLHARSSGRSRPAPRGSLFAEPEPFDAWAARREALLPADRAAVAAAMDRVNPVYIPRNHRVEEALTAATAGDLAPFHRLVDVVSRPYEERPGLDELRRARSRGLRPARHLLRHLTPTHPTGGQRPRPCA